MRNTRTYKIGQISSVYGIGPDSLRYYEKIGILNPQRDENNYRIYTTKDIYTLNILRELRLLGFSFTDIKQHLKTFDLDSTLRLFEQEIKVIHDKKEALEELEAVLSARIERINNNRALDLPSEPTLRNIKQRPILSLSDNVYLDEELDFVIKNIQNSVEDLYLIGRGETGATIPLEEIAQGQYGQFNAVFFITRQADEHNDYIQEATFLTLGVYGDYNQLPKAWQQLFNYLEANKLTPIGDPIELYIVDNHRTSNPEEYITELQIPILSIP